MTRSKLIALLCSAALCTGSFGLAACGGGAAETPAATTSAAVSPESVATPESAATPEAPADPAEKFIGTWKIAAAQEQGMYIAGDLAGMLELSGSSAGTLVLAADGTGKLSLWEEEDITWTLAGDDELAIEGSKATSAITFEDDALFFTAEADGEQATFVFTADGTWDQAKPISMDDATPVTDASELYGKWVMCGMDMGGISMYGDAETMAKSMGGEETFVTFNEDGTVDMAATSGTWKQAADGITLTSTDITGEHTVPVMKLGDNIALDYTGSFGEGVAFITVLAKS